MILTVDGGSGSKEAEVSGQEPGAGADRLQWHQPKTLTRQEYTSEPRYYFHPIGLSLAETEASNCEYSFHSLRASVHVPLGNQL